LKLQNLIGRPVSVYLADTEAPFEGFFQGMDEGFLVLTAGNSPDAEVSFIDRDSVWCVTAAETPREVLPS
jgi:hypothetical protein